MRSRYLHPRSIMLASVTLLFTWIIGLTMAATTYVATDFQGTYDLLYTRAFTDLTIVVHVPGHDPVTFELDVDQSLENELLPYSSVEPVITSVSEALQEYRPQMPEEVYTLVMEKVESSLHTLVDDINVQAQSLPDTMDIKIVNTRTGLADGVFTDTGNQEGEPITLRGSVTVSGSIGTISLMPVFEGQVDAAKGYSGAGSYLISDLAVEQMVKGVQINVSGDLQLDMNLKKL